MRDWVDFVGIPFEPRGRSFDGADCWGVVVLVYKHMLCIDLPSHADEYSEGTEAATLSAHLGEYRQVSAPRPFDIALLRQGGKPQHVGIIVDSDLMLHTTRSTGSVMERWNDRRWHHNFLGAYRRR